MHMYEYNESQFSPDIEAHDDSDIDSHVLATHSHQSECRGFGHLQYDLHESESHLETHH